VPRGGRIRLGGAGANIFWCSMVFGVPLKLTCWRSNRRKCDLHYDGSRKQPKDCSRFFRCRAHLSHYGLTLWKSLFSTAQPAGSPAASGNHDGSLPRRSAVLRDLFVQLARFVIADEMRQ
jgi:hypothetical protein